MRKAASVLVPVLLINLSLMFFSQREAHAYFDPATVSFIIQGLVGAMFAGLFALTVFWRRVKSAFVRLVLKRAIVQGRTKSDGNG